MSVSTEVSVITSTWNGVKKPTLVISIDALCAILSNEGEAVSNEDIPRVLGSLHTYAARADSSDQESLDAWEARVADMEEP